MSTVRARRHPCGQDAPGTPGIDGPWKEPWDSTIRVDPSPPLPPLPSPPPPPPPPHTHTNASPTRHSAPLLSARNQPPRLLLRVGRVAYECVGTPWDRMLHSPFPTPPPIAPRPFPPLPNQPPSMTYPSSLAATAAAIRTQTYRTPPPSRPCDIGPSRHTHMR